MSVTNLMWLRNDLRVADNPALHDARLDGTVIAIFLIADAQWASHHVAPRRLALIKESLLDVEASLARLGIPLWIEHVPWFAEAPAAILRIAKRCGASAVYWNAEYPWNEHRRDEAVRAACAAEGLQTQARHGRVILPPGSVLTGSGTPYTVFTPFKRRWHSLLTPDDWSPLPPPTTQQRPNVKLPARASIGGLPDAPDAAWPAGETAAARRLDDFVRSRVDRYREQRDFPAQNTTSQLSPYLAVGALSARTCLAAVRHAANHTLNATPDNPSGYETWISELVWRDFYHHVTSLFPQVSRGQAFRRETDMLPWRTSQEDYDRWREGMTGYPLVDAGMRQLLATGWMHNRLRMVTAMFLSKHLLLDWRLGERHFMERLVDGDFAANNGGWQWSSSTGTDAAPYFRIFNPASQAARFDPRGEFVREYIPELGANPPDDLFPSDNAARYPKPMIEHKFARERALAFFKSR